MMTFLQVYFNKLLYIVCTGFVWLPWSLEAGILQLEQEKARV